ncbi:MAG: ABC transporter ATP-binding protein [Acetobacteraceae bacterium]
MAEPPVLAACGVSKAYFGSLVLDSVSVEIAPRQITALLGPNGAGKTTLFDIMAGFTRASTGRIVYGGQDITRRPAFWRARHGIARTFQIPHEFDVLTAEENLLVAAPQQTGERFSAVFWRYRQIRREEKENRRRAREVLAFLELDEVRDAPARNLSAGQKKLLELARALMLDPKILMLDEPLAGVPAGLGNRILDRLAGLRARGVTLLVVEHNLEAIFRIADIAYVLVDGKLLAHGSPEAVQRDRRVHEAYLGPG